MTLDLATWPFWATLATAYLALTPTTGPVARKRLFALVNLGLIAAIVGPSMFGMVATLGCLAFLMVRAAAGDKHRTSAVQMLGLGLAITFLLAKRLDLSTALTIVTPARALNAIGFSYIMLRLIYLLRAVWERRAPAPSPSDFLCYVAPFHMLAAGPIATYEDYQASGRGVATLEDLVYGLERISTGLFKKFVLAGGIKTVFLTDYAHPNPWYALLEVQMSYIWLYLDFSGYSDIAVGAGRMLGFRLPENFDRPLLSRNLIEFWQRWHITLSDFVKTQIFMPIQFALMRGRFADSPLLAALISFNIAFLVCGLWHGVSLRFALWGLVHGLGLSLCRVYQSMLVKRLGRKRQKQWLANPWLHALSVFLTFEFVAFSWFIAIGPLDLLWKGLSL